MRVYKDGYDEMFCCLRAQSQKHKFENALVIKTRQVYFMLCQHFFA